MRVLFQPFRGRVELGQILRADGWTVEGVRDDAVLAEHPDVGDEQVARSRLHRLGLLPSCNFQIDRRLRCGERLVAGRKTGTSAKHPGALRQK